MYVYMNEIFIATLTDHWSGIDFILIVNGAKSIVFNIFRLSLITLTKQNFKKLPIRLTHGMLFSSKNFCVNILTRNLNKSQLKFGVLHLSHFATQFHSKKKIASKISALNIKSRLDINAYSIRQTQKLRKKCIFVERDSDGFEGQLFMVLNTNLVFLNIVYVHKTMQYKYIRHFPKYHNVYVSIVNQLSMTVFKLILVHLRTLRSIPAVIFHVHRSSCS